MKNEIKKLPEFKIIGISVRTTNQNGKSQKDIGELWGKFMGQNIIEQIPNKINFDIYCLYTDYESDFNGAYTTILGCKVNSLDNIPKGFIGKTFPELKYNLYKSEGKLPECVINTWIKIWESKIDRKYTVDFDVYGKDAQNPENAKVETYVSVK